MNIDLLRRFDLFAEIPDGDMQSIAAMATELSVNRDSILFSEGDPGVAFYFVQSGKIKIHRFSEDGREHIVHIIGAGDVLGEATLFSHMPYPASATVYEDARVLMLRNSEFEAWVAGKPEMTLSMLSVLSRKLMMTQKKLRAMTFQNVYARTATTLLSLSREHGVPVAEGTLITLSLSRQELADLVGTTRETVSRVVSRLKKEKALREKGPHLVVSDLKLLREWAENPFRST